jgi:hypothetical protein
MSIGVWEGFTRVLKIRKSKEEDTRAINKGILVILSKQIFSSPSLKTNHVLCKRKTRRKPFFSLIFFIFSPFLQAKSKESVLGRIISKRTN